MTSSKDSPTRLAFQRKDSLTRLAFQRNDDAGKENFSISPNTKPHPLDSSERRQGRRIQRLAMAASCRIKKITSSNSIKKQKKQRRRSSLPSKLPSTATADGGDVAVILGDNQVAIVPSSCKVTTTKIKKRNDPRLDERRTSRFQRYKERVKDGEEPSTRRRSARRRIKEGVPRFIKPIPYRDSSNSLGSLRIDSIPSFCKTAIELDDIPLQPQREDKLSTASTVTSSSSSMRSGTNFSPPKYGNTWVQKTSKWLHPSRRPSRNNLQEKRHSISEDDDFFLMDFEEDMEVALVGSSHYKKYLDGTSF